VARHAYVKSRQRRWDTALLAAHLVLFVGGLFLLWKMNVTDAVPFFVGCGIYVLIAWLVAILRTRLEERHERWLLETGVSVTAFVSTVFARSQPDPNSSDPPHYVVLAVGVDPVTELPAKFEFLTDRPLYFKKGAPVRVKVNPNNTSDYALEG
jgi:uncharacterized membrane protein HdeD (DUF308 family)